MCTVLSFDILQHTKREWGRVFDPTQLVDDVVMTNKNVISTHTHTHTKCSLSLSLCWPAWGGYVTLISTAVVEKKSEAMKNK